MRRKIDSLLEEQVRPGLAAHGGNVEVIDVDNKKIINLTVEEMPSGEIMAGAGAGSSGTSITGGVKEKNYLTICDGSLFCFIMIFIMIEFLYIFI